MFKLENSALSAKILDPIADKHLLGSRYCAGGYIYQIQDRNKGDLLAGPTYPDGIYNSFDGQGAPEVFITALNDDNAKVGEDVVVPGVGVVLRTSPITPFHVRDNPVVKEFAQWDVLQAAGEIIMRTRQVFEKWDLYLLRSVSLDNRTITSKTVLFNKGTMQCPLRWFPHPFFPYPKDHVACRFGFPVSVPQNPGFFLNEQGIVALRRAYDWKKGFYQPLVMEKKELFSAVQIHPLVNSVSVTCDYSPSILPIWANQRTFSFEPYLEKQIQCGEEFSWKIEYRV
jgi:hypothetical protein